MQTSSIIFITTVMKPTETWKPLLLLGFGLFSSTQASTYDFTSSVNASIPDFGISGGTPTLFPINIPAPLGVLSDINIRIQLDGGANSDISAYLLYGDDLSDPFAVLFDQIQGTTSGMNVRLDDDAPVSPDIQTIGGSGVLTGSFRPAGPETLSNFNGVDPTAKTWYLALADNSSGLESRLIEWELEITTPMSTSAPESPRWAGLATILSCLTIHAFGRRIPAR